jgi:hypothetical protein
MIGYIEELERYAERCNAAREAIREARAREKCHAVREKLIPLEDRLMRLLATIPMEIQHEGLSLSTLQSSLRGRSRGHCHPGELGAALRKLGFQRKRRWDGNSGYGAVWYPSVED